jgi:SAM-dependent methyltransferase
VYNAPPAVEIGFPRANDEPYYREVWQFEISNHFVSRHAMNVALGYAGDYVDATYSGGAGIARTFERIIALPPERSDNSGRIRRIREFAATRFGESKVLDLLDVGAGLGVFPYAVKQAGWNCTAIDPDRRAVDHMRERVGVTATCGDFMKIAATARFDLVTLNKVLEHVEDPIAMLRRARDFLAPGGCVYIEVPDGEMAAREGSEREEFTVEHLHVFSFISTVMTANRAGYYPLTVERTREPSTKFTLRAFLALKEFDS